MTAPGRGVGTWWRGWRGAVVVAGVYLAVALATLGATSRHRFLPLFEGVGPPPKYSWVKPPASLAAGNTVPKVATADFPLTGPAEPFLATTTDGQFEITLAANTFASHGSDTKVHCIITPLDPSTLAPLPTGEAADGNAYQIELTYEPSGAPVPSLTAPGSVVLTAPYTADFNYYSADGQAWTKLPSLQVSGPTVLGSMFTRAGYFVVGTAPHRLRTSTPGAKSTVSTVVVAAAVVAVALLLGAVAAALLSRGRRDEG